MNFFGHAAVASWSAAAGAGVVLGAMLPDFATMCGGQIASADEDPVSEGIALHHATDAVFHQLPVVTGLMRELDERLRHGRCARGPRRATAHIGVELLLDGVLTGEPAYRAAYLSGLAHDPALQWRDPDDAPRFSTLLDRLRARGVPDDLRAIHGALVAFQPRIDVAADTIVRAMRAALDVSPTRL